MISFFNPLINQKIGHTCNVHKHYAASYIALWKPNLNDQKDFERLVLFRNGVT